MNRHRFVTLTDRFPRRLQACWLLLVALVAGPALAQTQASAQPAPAAQQPTVYVCPLHPDVQSKLPGKCPKCGVTLAASVAGGSDDGFFACPMHPDVISAKDEKCPKCGMSLARMAAPESGDYEVKLEATPAARPGEKTRLRLLVFHPKTDELVKDFNLLHEMPFHLFVISQDLAEFQHIHPAKQPDGSFVIETVLPRPGHYKVFCDFFPAGGTPQVIQLNMATAGFKGDLASSEPNLVADKSLSKVVDGIRFDLKFDPADPVAGREAVVTYSLSDEKTGQPVKDLEPYLGAWGHTLILSQDATDYLHSHPTEMIPAEGDRAKLTGGPVVSFDTFFPRPGHYRIWSQFQRAGRITTVSFTLYVPRLQ